MRRIAAALVLLALAGCSRVHEETLAHGRFTRVIVTRPQAAPDSVVLLMTDRDGWSSRARALSRDLARAGTLVIAVPLPEFYAELEKDAGGCEYTGGDLENLSHFVQAWLRLGRYQPPILLGEGEGAAFAYANFAQAPKGAFSGLVSAGLQPRLRLRQQLCDAGMLVTRRAADGFALDLAAALPDWKPLETADAPAIVAAARKLAAEHPAPPSRLPQTLADLPIVELPAAHPGPLIALFWSGDGGWAGLDQDVAGALVARGIGVIGVDSLRYFWSERTPEKLAADVDRIVRWYLGQWQARRVLLIGFSQGADVLPFAMTRLSADVRSRIALFVPMSLARHAAFEFHVSNWIGSVDEGHDTKAEVLKIQDTPVLCIYGEEDEDSVCPELKDTRVQLAQLPGSHHFNGDYERLAAEILKAVSSSGSAAAGPAADGSNRRGR